MTVRITKIKPLPALKMVAGSLTCFYSALGLFFGLLAWGGCHTVRWNGEPVTGIWALPYAALFAAMMSIGSTIITWIALTVGLAIFQWIYPTDFECELSKEAPNPAAPTATAVTAAAEEPKTPGSDAGHR